MKTRRSPRKRGPKRIFGGKYKTPKSMKALAERLGAIVVTKDNDITACLDKDLTTRRFKRLIEHNAFLFEKRLKQVVGEYKREDFQQEKQKCVLFSWSLDKEKEK